MWLREKRTTDDRSDVSLKLILIINTIFIFNNVSFHLVYKPINGPTPEQSPLVCVRSLLAAELDRWRRHSKASAAPSTSGLNFEPTEPKLSWWTAAPDLLTIELIADAPVAAEAPFINQISAEQSGGGGATISQLSAAGSMTPDTILTEKCLFVILLMWMFKTELISTPVYPVGWFNVQQCIMVHETVICSWCGGSVRTGSVNRKWSFISRVSRRVWSSETKNEVKHFIHQFRLWGSRTCLA